MWGLCLGLLVSMTGPSSSVDPANPNALPQTRAVMRTLSGLEAKGKTVSGQLELTNSGGLTLSNGNNHVTLTQIRTGEWTGIIGAQWDPGSVDPAMMQDQFEEYWNAGGIPHLTSMPRNPRNPDYGRFWNAADAPDGDDGNDYFINMDTLLSTGSQGEAYSSYYADLDLIAAQLQILEDKGIVVLFRPLAENNGPWFWWGSNESFLVNDPDRYADYIQLWRETFDYLTNTKGLNNLLWVFESANTTPDKRDVVRPHPSLLYPGDAYVDFVAMNTTVEWDEPMDRTVIWPEVYDWMASTAKPIAFSQCGARNSGADPWGDNMKVINGMETDFPEVTWWMAWRDHFSIARNLNHTNMLAHPRVVNRDDLPDFDL